VTSRDRFPGLADGWARLDGAAGTLMVDTAIDAMTDFMRSPCASNLLGAAQDLDHPAPGIHPGPRPAPGPW